MYSVRQHSYTGLSGIPEVFDSHTRARDEIAHRITRARGRGFPVVTLSKGATWEIMEPDGAAGVPDACGTLHLNHITYECRECGHQCETRDAAIACCRDDADNYCAEGE